MEKQQQHLSMYSTSSISLLSCSSTAGARGSEKRHEEMITLNIDLKEEGKSLILWPKANSGKIN